VTEGFHEHPDRVGIFVPLRVMNLVGGDHSAAVLLAQLLWWHRNDDVTGRPKLTFERQGFLWLLRSDDEWEQECLLTALQVRRIRRLLLEKELVVCARFGVNRAPTSAWRPNRERLELEALRLPLTTSPIGQVVRSTTSPEGQLVGSTTSPIGQVATSLEIDLKTKPSGSPDGDPTDKNHPAYGFERFWDQYPRRDGKRLHKSPASLLWRKLTYDEKASAFKGAKNYKDACEKGIQRAMDAVRFLREQEWQEWQTPATPDTPKRPERNNGYSSPDEQLFNQWRETTDA
jgi:hypothetical protein